MVIWNCEISRLIMKLRTFLKNSFIFVNTRVAQLLLILRMTESPRKFGDNPPNNLHFETTT